MTPRQQAEEILKKHLPNYQLLNAYYQKGIIDSMLEFNALNTVKVAEAAWDACYNYLDTIDTIVSSMYPNRADYLADYLASITPSDKI